MKNHPLNKCILDHWVACYIRSTDSIFLLRQPDAVESKTRIQAWAQVITSQKLHNDVLKFLYNSAKDQ